MKERSPAKRGWHWTSPEVAELKRYIARRKGRAAPNRSEVRRIAERMGRDYFAVYRKIKRLEQLCLPTNSRNKPAIGGVNCEPDFYCRLKERAFSLGLTTSAYIRSLIAADLDAAKCSRAKRKAERVGSRDG